ncbi:MAG: DUF7715 family protein [Pseudonocardia sp.]
MKIMVATARTQGARPGDYHFCIEGELVRLTEVCARDQADPDGGCGCGRAFGGLGSHRATTTVRVADLPLTMADYALALQSSEQAQGWNPCAECALAEAVDLADLALSWPVDTVLERRLDELVVRGIGAGT